MSPKEKQDTYDLVEKSFERAIMISGDETRGYNFDASDRADFLDLVKEGIFGPPDQEEVPVLIGHTTRLMGYGGFHPIEVGTPVHKFRGLYYVKQTSLDGKTTVDVKYGDNLIPVIKFL